MQYTSAHVGCCGFAMAQARYLRAFRLLEVEQTFYQPPGLATLRRLARPDDGA